MKHLSPPSIRRVVCSSLWRSPSTSLNRRLSPYPLNYGFSTPCHRARRRCYSHSTKISKPANQLGLGMKNTISSGLDWDDRIGLQDQFTLEEKGWEVKVDWRSTPYGAGLFSKENVEAGRVLRKGILGVNLKEFTSIADIDDFCHNGAIESERKNTIAYKAKLNYVKDYLWGFNKEADDRGYNKIESPPSDSDRFFGMWIPGNGLNHNETPNTIYKATADGIDLVALVDIQEDDELFDDYRRHGTSSPWLKEFASIHNVTLNFADCNDFV